MTIRSSAVAALSLLLASSGLAQSASLATTKVATTGTVAAGANVTYDITVTNNGPDPAQNVELQDVVRSSEFSFVSFAQTGGPAFTLAAPPPGTDGGFVTATAPALASGQTATFRLVANVDADVPPGTTVTNTATGTTTTHDPTPNNNVSDAHVLVTPSGLPDLVLTKSDSPDPVAAGETITYTMTVQNAGPADAQDVVLTDVVASRVTFESAAQISGPPATLTPPAGGQGTFRATMAALPAGGTAVFTLTVRVASGPFVAGTLIRNDAEVSASTPDPTPANNSVAAETEVIARIDQRVAKSVGGGPHPPGSLLTYTLTIENLGPTLGTNVGLVDPIPEHTTFVSAVQTSGQGFTMSMPEPGGTGEFRASSTTQTNFFGFFLGTATFDLIVRVDDDVPAGTVISNTVRTQTFVPDGDPDLTNNSQTVVTTVDAAAPAIPSLSEWMLLLLAAALCLTGVAAIRG